MEDSSELGRLGNRGSGDRVQVGDDGRGVSVNAGADGQSRESGLGVELEEGGLEVLAVQEDDGLELDVDTELSAERGILEYAVYTPIREGYSHGDLGNGGPDGVGESVDGWLLKRRIIRRPSNDQGLAGNQP